MPRQPPSGLRQSVREQVELAIRLRKPLFMHCRDAGQRMAELLAPLAPRLAAPGVVHCFTGTVDEACGPPASDPSCAQRGCHQLD